MSEWVMWDSTTIPAVSRQNCDERRQGVWPHVGKSFRLGASRLTNLKDFHTCSDNAGFFLTKMAFACMCLLIMSFGVKLALFLS